MNANQQWSKQIAKLGFLFLMGVSMSAEAGLFGLGEVSWKEEVLFHDGRKIIVTRSQSYGGRHEIGQSSSVKEHIITFVLPNSSKTLTFTSEYGEDIGRAKFNLLALHVLSSTPYLVVEPNLCLAYEKWGRPNPPYLFFRHDGKTWQRISLAEFPAEFKTINLIVNNGREKEIGRLASTSGYVTAHDVGNINSSLTQSEYKSILREPLASSQLCPPEQTGFKAPYRIPSKSGVANGK